MLRPTWNALFALCGLLLLGVALASLAVRKDDGYALMRYRDQHLLFPLFAFPGTDPDALAMAVRTFSRSASAALPLFPEGAQVRDAIYPIAFLSAIAPAEEARRTLLYEPSAASAKNYHDALLALIDAHQEALARADSVLLASRATSSLQFQSGKTTIAHVRAVLRSAQKASAEARAREEARYACLSGSSLRCERAGLLALTFGSVALVPSPVSQTPGVIAEHQSMLSAIYPDLAQSPVYTLGASVCFPDTPVHYGVAHTPSRLSGASGSQAVYLDDLLFENTASSTHPLYARLHAAGGTYKYQALTPYSCPDVGYDEGRVFSLARAHAELSQRPFAFAQMKTRDAQVLSSAQAAVLQSTGLKEDAYLSLTRAIAQYVRKAGLSQLSMSLGTKEEVRLLELATEARARSSDFAGVVGRFDDLQVGSYIPYKLNPTPPEVFLIARGGLSQLYALSNETVFPDGMLLVESRTDAKNPFAQSDIPLISYRESLAHALSPAQIEAALRQDALAHTRAFGGYIEELKKLRERE